ncbi:hypothetical protein ACFE04_001727 [Oxalis oulophora]
MILHNIAADSIQLQLPEDVRDSGFNIGPDQLASISRSHDKNAFESIGGLEGLAKDIKVFNEINSRDMEKINIFRGIFDSLVFVIVMIATVVFQVIIVEFLGTFAKTVPLSMELWLGSILIGAVSLPLAVILKLIPVERSRKATIFKPHNGYEPLPSGPDMA